MRDTRLLRAAVSQREQIDQARAPVEEVSIPVRVRRLHAELEVPAAGNVEVQVYGVFQAGGLAGDKRGRRCAKGNQSAVRQVRKDDRFEENREATREVDSEEIERRRQDVSGKLQRRAALAVRAREVCR